jgi:peptidoglycan hydrolase-like protein with peptidoglycan-binding domain/cell wall-associated NlpC family hydrolase
VGVLVSAPSAEAVSASGSKTKFIASLVSPAQATQRKFGVPASVSMAQAIEASDWGTSAVAKKANNYFDTPCGGSMTASQYAALADAQVGKPYRLGANGPGVFDCSSLVIWLNNQSGAFRMGDDTAAGMYNRSRRVVGSPAVGDMVFLRNNPARANGIGHMAVLTKKLSNGDWRIIEARGRAYGVVRSTLSFWKQRSYYAGLRRFSTIAFAKSAEVAASAARLYQSGCVTIDSTRYANFTSVTNSFYANAAAITSDAAYKSARSVMASTPEFVKALAKVVKPKDADSYARTVNSLIDTFSLTDYDVVPIGIVLKSGSNGAKVTALQYLVKAAGQNLSITGKFDSATVSAVKKLQKAKKLDPDGEAGERTLSALFTKIGGGAVGPRVNALNTLLGSLGYAVSTGGDVAGATLAALKSFQAASGRPVTGVVDKQTWAALFMTLDADQPTVNGTAQVGQALQVSAGNWGPGVVSLSYQWYRGATAISGATAERYDVPVADAGSTLKVVVTGLKPGYTRTSRGSASTAPVHTASLTATPVPKITGTIRVGEALTAVPGVWAPGAVSLAFQWYRGGQAIKGATAARYTLAPADAGASLTVSVTGSRDGFTSVTKSSVATSSVTKANLSSVSSPKIAGTRKAGKTLSVMLAQWGPGPVAYRYQWYRGSSLISGAASKSYTVRAADRHKSLYVKVTGSRDGYNSVTKKSAAAKIA